MDEPIFFIARDFKPKGHQQGSQPDIQKVKSMIYEEDYTTIDSFIPSSQIQLSTDQPTLFYPGSGCDILMPLFYIERLLPSISEFTFIFIDIEHFLPLIKTILDDINIPFTNTQEGIIFYWKNQKITLHYQAKDVFSSLTDLKPFDIYFEKAFRIIKEESTNVEEYEYSIIQKLNPNGIIISDSGFQNQELEYIKIPKELSSYSEMVLAQKRNLQN
ncbi:hypothetical protein HYV86_06300 [Candidatus Woesearchaeota archaeon]|nr:hypothetical protein [Candidatus Woesearchaeota archaeon]